MHRGIHVQNLSSQNLRDLSRYTPLRLNLQSPQSPPSYFHCKSAPSRMRDDRAIAARFAWSRFVMTAFLHVADAAFQIYGRQAERGAAVQLGRFLPKPRPNS